MARDAWVWARSVRGRSNSCIPGQENRLYFFGPQLNLCVPPSPPPPPPPPSSPPPSPRPPPPPSPPPPSPPPPSPPPPRREYMNGNFRSIGEGVCRAGTSRYPPYGSQYGSEQTVASRCLAQSSCLAYWHHSGNGYQVFCSSRTGICNNNGNGVTSVDRGHGQNTNPCMKRISVPFQSIGSGACRYRSHNTYPPWGTLYGSEASVADRCYAQSSCLAYWRHTGSTYQVFCSSRGGICPNNPSNAGVNDIRVAIGHNSNSCMKKPVRTCSGWNCATEGQYCSQSSGYTCCHDAQRGRLRWRNGWFQCRGRSATPM